MRVQDLLTLEEAAPLAGLSAVSLRRLCAQGKVRGAVKKGRTWLVPAASVHGLRTRGQS